MFIDRAVNGMVAIDTHLVQTPELPTVTVSSPNAQLSVTNIVLNHECAATLALRHLVDLGHRKVAVIKGQSFSSDREPRWQRIQEEAAQFGLELARSSLCIGSAV